MEKKLIVTENKLSFVAERLEAPIILDKFNLMGQTDINSGYVDAFLGIERIKFDQETSVLADKTELNKKKEKLK